MLRDDDDGDVFHDARATSIPLLMMMMMGGGRRRRSQKMTMILLLCLAVFLLLLQEEDLVVFVVAKAPSGSSESSFAASCGTCQRCATVSEEEEDKGFEGSFEEVKERGADKNERFRRSSSLSSSTSSDEGHDNAKAKELAENGNKCDVCFGCTHVLKEMVRTVTMKNKTYESEIGASPATLVKVKRREKKTTTTTKSDEEDEEWAIAKMWCVGEKRKPDGATVDQGGAGVCYRKEGNVIVDATSPQRTKAVRTMRNSVTMQKILDYCDASEISVRH